MAVLYVMFLVYLLSVLVQKPDNLVVARGMVLLWRCSTALSNLLLQGLLPSLTVNWYPLNLDYFYQVIADMGTSLSTSTCTD